MKKVRVLLLSGCSKCEELCNKLDALNIPYESMDADDNSKLCDRVEALLNTVNYPILILEDIENITYLYRVDDSTNLGKHTITDTVSKCGCLDVNQMAQQLSLILN